MSASIRLAGNCEQAHNAPMKTKDAIDHFVSREALADALHIDRTAIYHWGEYVPELRQYQLQVLTAGKLRTDSANRECNCK